MPKLTTTKLLRILKQSERECKESMNDERNTSGIRDAFCAVGLVLWKLRQKIKEETK